MSRARPLVSPPAVVRWSVRSGESGDCVLAAVALATGRPYEEVCAAAGWIARHPTRDGLDWNETQRLVRRLGLTPRVRRRGQFDLTADTGILGILETRDVRSSHAVYLWEGRILEPGNVRRALWLDPERFMAHYRCRPGSLIVIEGHDA